MAIFLAPASLALILIVLLDGFEAMVLPRRVMHPYRLARLFYQSSWRLWRGLAGALPAGRRREAFLSVFGPLSLLALFATWLAGLILGFGLLHWSLGSPVQVSQGTAGLGTYLYLSGGSFFTLGYGDVTPTAGLGRFLAVTESGIGLGFLALIISYLPVLYQAFSRREAAISMLDARAGSPPSAAQLLLRLAQARNLAAVDPFLAEWERWAAELLESHLSFPVLSYYRSQHDNQSWLAALTAVLDTCSFLLAGIHGANRYQVQLTFAMARHAVVDLALYLKIPPQPPDPDRLPEARLQRLRALGCEAGLPMCDGPAPAAQLAQLRGMYEPFVNALARYLLLSLPEILPEKSRADNWQTSAWMRRTPGIGQLPVADGPDHF